MPVPEPTIPSGGVALGGGSSPLERPAYDGRSLRRIPEGTLQPASRAGSERAATMRQSKRMTLATFVALFAIIALAEGNAHAQASYTPPNEELPNPYRPPQPFGHLPNNRQLPFFTGITVDSNNHVWGFARCQGGCAGKTEDLVLEFDTSGKLLRSWGGGTFNNPHSIDVDRDGNVWLVDSGIANGRGSQVFKYTPDGKLLMTLGKAGVTGNGPDEFNEPNAVKVAPNGDVFVASAHKFPACEESRIQKFSKDGKFIKEFGGKGSGPGATTCPHQMAFDSNGRLFVAELGKNFRISVFDQDGKFIAGWKQFGSATGVYIDRNDLLYVTDSISTDDMNMNKASPGHGYNPGVKRGIRIGSARDGKVTGFIPDPNPLTVVHGRETLAVDRDGNIYQVPDSSDQYLEPYFKKYVKK
jgi:hypothetical protein